MILIYRNKTQFNSVNFIELVLYTAMNGQTENKHDFKTQDLP